MRKKRQKACRCSAQQVLFALALLSCFVPHILERIEPPHDDKSIYRGELFLWPLARGLCFGKGCISTFATQVCEWQPPVNPPPAGVFEQLTLVSVVTSCDFHEQISSETLPLLCGPTQITTPEGQYSQRQR